MADHYRRSGHTIAAERWRGPGGEIDLIAERDGAVVFVEVKKARSHAEAAARLGARQLGRILSSAEAYLGASPGGTLTEARVDVALVDAMGRIEIVENAAMA